MKEYHIKSTIINIELLEKVNKINWNRSDESWSNYLNLNLILLLWYDRVWEFYCERWWGFHLSRKWSTFSLYATAKVEMKGNEEEEEGWERREGRSKRR